MTYSVTRELVIISTCIFGHEFTQTLPLSHEAFVKGFKIFINAKKKIEKKVAKNMYLPKYLGRYVFSTKKNLRYVGRVGINVQNFKINFNAGSIQHWVKL